MQPITLFLRLAAFFGSIARLFKWIGALFLVVYVAFLLSIIGLKYFVLPQINDYKAWVEKTTSQSLGLTVKIGNLSAQISGVTPQLSAQEVSLTDTLGHTVLMLPRVDSAISWFSVLRADITFQHLRIQAPTIEARRLKNGSFSIAGLLIDPADRRKGGGLKWLLAQREIQIADATLLWTDETRLEDTSTPSTLRLSSVDMLLQNQGRSHKFGLTASPPEQFGSPLDVRANFSHSLFEDSDNPQHWSGEIFLQVAQVDLAHWIGFANVDERGIVARRGQGAVRSWLAFNAMTVSKLTVDLAMADVSLKLGQDLSPIEFRRVAGRLEGRQFQSHLASHEIAVSNLVLTTSDGKQMQPITLTERFDAATSKEGARGYVAAQALDLQTLSELSEKLPLTAPVREALSKFDPKGQLRQLQIQWHAPLKGSGGTTEFLAKGDFSEVEIRAQNDRTALTRLLAPSITAPPSQPPSSPITKDTLPLGVPGFSKLSGRFEVSQKGGVVHVRSEKATLTFPGVFEDPTLPFEKLAFEASWVIAPKEVEVKIRNAQLVSPQITASIKADYSTGGKGPGFLELDAKLSKVQANSIHRFLPLGIEEPARHWVRNALTTGTANEGSIRLKGDLHDFPFAPEANNKSTGEFRITAKLKDVGLNYVPFDLPNGARWLPIEKLSGTFVLDRNRLSIKDAQGSILKTRLSRVNAEIPNLLNLRVEPLLITGQTEGPAQDAISFINASPLGANFDHFTENTTVSGVTKLDLKLTLPLLEIHKIQVSGAAILAGNTLALNPILPTFTNTHGRFEFSEKGITLGPTRAQAYEGPVSLSGGTQADGSLAFTGDGTASVAATKELLGDPTLAKLISTAHGSFKYAVAVNIKNGQSEIRMSSDLIGVSMDFPGIISKTPAQSLPLKVNLTPQRTQGGQALRDELTISLGPMLAVRMERQQNKAGQMTVLRGGIGINNEAVLPESGTIAIINVKKFDVDLWSKRIDDLQLSLEGAQPHTAQDEVSLIPKLIAIRADELVIGGKRWEKVVAGATREGDVWQINMDATQISGHATWKQGGRNGGLGRVSGKLARLIIPQSQREELATFLEAQEDNSAVRALPGFDLTVDEFELAGIKLGKFEVVANNIRSSWQLEKLELANSESKLKATGEWLRATNKGSRTMTMNFSLEMTDAGKLLNRLGLVDILRGGEGQLTGKVNWKGSPLSLDLPTLSGQLQLEIDKGQFLKSDPGVARLLGILSLQSLIRRLSFDFRDVFAEGFSFDTIRADAKVSTGLLATNNFKMKGPQAAVLMEGTVDLPRETQKLHVVVLPELNAGAISLAYIFINPAIGIGTLLAQAALRDSFSKGLSQEWDVSGTWTKPDVIKRERSSNANVNKTESLP